jgi:hypothetical protein
MRPPVPPIQRVRPEWPACCEVRSASCVLLVFDKNQTGESPEWPACCEVHSASCVLLVFEKNQTGESPEWPACCEVHPSPFVLSVFVKNQTGESPVCRWSLQSRAEEMERPPATPKEGRTDGAGSPEPDEGGAAPCDAQRGASCWGRQSRSP